MKSSIPAVAALVGLVAAQANITTTQLPVIPTLTTILTSTATITSCPGGCTHTSLAPIPLPTRAPIGSNGTYTYAGAASSGAVFATSTSTVSPSILPATGSADHLAVGGSLLMALVACAALV